MQKSFAKNVRIFEMTREEVAEKVGYEVRTIVRIEGKCYDD